MKIFYWYLDLSINANWKSSSGNLVQDKFILIEYNIVGILGIVFIWDKGEKITGYLRFTVNAINIHTYTGTITQTCRQINRVLMIQTDLKMCTCTKNAVHEINVPRK